MDLTTVSLLISAIVAIVQIINFIDNKKSKAESKLNVFAKAVDVEDKLKVTIDSFTNSLSGFESRLNAHEQRDATSHEDISRELDNTSEKMQTLKTYTAVNDEKLANIYDCINRIDDKLEKILESL